MNIGCSEQEIKKSSSRQCSPPKCALFWGGRKLFLIFFYKFKLVQSSYLEVIILLPFFEVANAILGEGRFPSSHYLLYKFHTILKLNNMEKIQNLVEFMYQEKNLKRLE